MPAALPPESRGTLFPDRLPPRFRRLAPDPELGELVTWWWISEWDLAEGERSEQHLLAFPASNLAVESAMVGFAGPTTRGSTRVLEGRGWVVGAQLRPAAVTSFADDPRRLRDVYEELDEPGLHALVSGVTADGRDLEGAVAPVGRWLRDRVGPVPEEARVANRMAELAASDPEITTVAELASRLAVSERTLHRLADRYVGLTPYVLIRRRRLQEAAQDLRAIPEDPLAEVAARHGFADQAHFGREFRRALGMTPAAYRTEARARAETQVRRRASSTPA